MKKYTVICLILALMFSLCACQKNEDTGHGVPGTTEDTIVPTQTSDDTEPSADHAKMLETYQFALQQISFEHIYPDGTDIGFDSNAGFIENNNFAVFDVDGDGLEELIVSITTASMAGQTEIIYQYDPAAENSLRIQFLAFPALTYYTGGVIRAESSHNHTLSMTQWPYDLYSYDAEKDTYTKSVSVYAWDKDFAETDGNGYAYPQDADTDNTGTVFCINKDGSENWVSKSAYESWLSDAMGTAEKIDIPYQPLTEENIKKVTE